MDSRLGKSVRRSAMALLVAAGLASMSASAALLDFNFTFENIGHGGGTVTGIVRGLEDDATGPASSVEVLSNTLGFGLGEYIGSPILNTFTVLSGLITDGSFLSIGLSNTAPAVTCCSLVLFASTSIAAAGLAQDPLGVVLGLDARLRFSQVGAVPEPATLALVGLGLLGFGFARRRKQ